MIKSLVPYVIAKAKELKRHRPRVKYRNMRITHAEVTPSKIGFGLQGLWQTAGPMM